MNERSIHSQVAKPLGKEGGVPVLMLLHHSRDTASKQWDETWVLLLHSSTRLFRAFLPTLMARPRFSKAWARLLAFCRTSLLAARRSVEVSKAAIHALVHELLCSTVALKTPRRASSSLLAAARSPQRGGGEGGGGGGGGFGGGGGQGGASSGAAADEPGSPADRARPNASEAAATPWERDATSDSTQ